MKILITICVVTMLIALIIVFKDEMFKVKENILDNEKFYMDYPKVSVDNVYKYITAKEAINIFENGTGIILFGFKECVWCQSYAPLLNKLAKDKGIDTIYYVDIKEDRSMNTEEYKTLTTILSNYLYDDSKGNKRIYVPDVYFVSQGEILGHNNDTSTEEGKDIEYYYTQNEETLKTKLNELLDKMPKTCNDNEKGC